MTPCEKLGYKVGDKLEVIGNHSELEKGTVVYLVEDDGSACPQFRTEGVNAYFFVFLEKVKPLKENEPSNNLNIDWDPSRKLLTQRAFRKEVNGSNDTQSMLATRQDIINTIYETGVRMSLGEAIELADTLLETFNIEK